MEPEIAADDKEDSHNTLILQTGQPTCESLAAPTPPLLVECNQFPTLFTMAQQRFRLEPEDPLGIVFAAAGHRT